MNTGDRAPARTGSLALRAATGLIGLMFLLFVAVLAVLILRERELARDAAESRAAAASQVVATNARWITELSRQALGRIDEALGAEIDSQDAVTTRQRVQEAVARLPGNVKTYVADAKGDLLFSTDPAFRPISVANREYFTALLAGVRFHVSPLLTSRLDGSQVFVFSRRLDRNGAFAGAAFISFDVTLFREIWESLSMDDTSTVSIVRDDGQLVARYPLADGPLDLSGYALFTEYLKISEIGTYPAVSPADGVTRIVGYRRVPGTPLVAIASVSTQAAFAQFWRNTIMTLAFAVPTAIALMLAIFWIVRLVRNDERTRAQLVETIDLNRMLVRDTHHRVKNNLQAIMSLVRLHRLPQELKTDLQGRITAMTAVHEHLYRLDQFTDVDAVSLLPAIVEPLNAAFARQVRIEYDIDPIILHHDHATPVALVINELVTNALKYAFPDGRTGRLRIALKSRPDGATTLSVTDDGVGFDPLAVSTGLGSRLIRAMLVQLGGNEHQYTFEGGTRFFAELHLATTEREFSAGHAQAAE
ncbi:sensor histidine kinase [Aquibium oceanicum]|uniref:sensor histidine kinase n=1 Tax=Aquibium oceanicum TaxID=1670800 RepID=UPI00138FD361|nr:histidine kinase dimerization/phosphoacceptor domain -containing protein [Aquibium oceanicum]